MIPSNKPPTETKEKQRNAAKNIAKLKRNRKLTNAAGSKHTDIYLYMNQGRKTRAHTPRRKTPAEGFAHFLPTYRLQNKPPNGLSPFPATAIIMSKEFSQGDDY